MPNMPNGPFIPPFFRFGAEPMEIDGHTKKRELKRERTKAYKSVIGPKMLAHYRQEYESKTDALHCITFTEFATFKAENREYVLEDELLIIRTKYFGFPVIQHSEDLVEFYTGLPNASQFYYINSILQRWIFRSYIKWDSDEKHGFLNHTMMVLMKLRLNMTDEELAERFGIDTYMVNMTMRTWLPGLYMCVYKISENMTRLLNNEDGGYLYSKVLDIVEVCFETPEYTRRHRGNQHEARKAVVSVRVDGFIHYASSVVSVNRPDADTIRRSRFADTCSVLDSVAAFPEHSPAMSAMGISCCRMQNHAELNLKEAMSRLSEFRILSAIPEEYKTCHEYIFPVCAALSNFYLVADDEFVPHEELPNPQDYDQE